MECLMVTFAFREMTMQQFAGIVFGIFRNNKHAEQFVGNESENIIHFTNEILYFLGILSGVFHSLSLSLSPAAFSFGHSSVGLFSIIILVAFLLFIIQFANGLLLTSP
jgi:cellulose synthase/poly-beta-1,6-N-acetylglucosamine synthase-like glycosyltransferase